jgi:hypothetical protein
VMISRKNSQKRVAHLSEPDDQHDFFVTHAVCSFPV